MMENKIDTVKYPPRLGAPYDGVDWISNGHYLVQTRFAHGWRNVTGFVWELDAEYKMVTAEKPKFWSWLEQFNTPEGLELLELTDFLTTLGEGVWGKKYRILLAPGRPPVVVNAAYLAPFERCKLYQKADLEGVAAFDTDNSNTPDALWGIVMPIRVDFSESQKQWRAIAQHFNFDSGLPEPTP